MKTILKKYFVIVMMFVTVISFANVKHSNLPKIDGKKVLVAFKYVKKGQQIAIKDQNGTVLYSEVMPENGDFSKVFNFNKLASGIYTAELQKKYEILIKPFNVVNGKVSLLKEEIIFKPVIRKQKDLILISKISFDKAPMKIIIYYKDKMILSEYIHNDSNLLKKVYQLSAKFKGDYSVVINSDHRTYTQDFKI